MDRQKLVVISMDALVYEDIQYLAQQGSFRWLIENGAMVKRMRSIYPTLTYPCHVTMATGCYPDKHGVVNNTEHIVGEKNPPWLFEHTHVRCSDIFDACKKYGLTTAAVGWPVTGNHPAVDYLVDECWPYNGIDEDAYREAYLKTGTSEKLFREVIEPVLQMRIGRKQPESSFFLTHISAEIIRRYQPDILMMHQGNVDSFRHKTGVCSTKVEEGLRQCEEMLAEIIQATKDAGVFEQTNFVVTADHGHLNTSRTVHINALLVDKGFIDVDSLGQVVSWRAYCFPTGMSAQVYLHDSADIKLYESVHTLLNECCDSGLWGISKVYTREEVSEEEHLDGSFSFILETDNTTSFGLEWLGPFACPYPSDKTGCVGGNHGYHPEKGMCPPLLACGPSVERGVVLPSANLVDGAPTYAKLLNVMLQESDGIALTELIKTGGDN